VCHCVTVSLCCGVQGVAHDEAELLELQGTATALLEQLRNREQELQVLTGGLQVSSSTVLWLQVFTVRYHMYFTGGSNVTHSSLPHPRC